MSITKWRELSEVATGGVYFLGVVAFCGAVFAGLMTNGVAYADGPEVDQVNITVPVSCTLDGIGMNSHTANINNRDYETEIGSTTLTAYCNDVNGFSIYAIGYSNDEYGNTDMIGINTEELIHTGTTLDGTTSNWAMKLSTDPNATYPITIQNSYNNYKVVPTTFTLVAKRESSTDLGTAAIGSILTTTYAASVSPTQVADTYIGKVRYTLVHPNNEIPAEPQITASGHISYYPNTNTIVDTMADQEITDSATSAVLWPSNFQRPGYGFAGWSETYDYSDPTKIHGPMESITFTAGQYSGDNDGLSLYAYWIESKGVLQGWTCPDNTTMPVGSVTALTDLRDNNTYAVAKLVDGKCWTIENLRISSEHIENNSTKPTTLTVTNTNNPSLPLVNADSSTSNSLSASIDPTQTAWCNSSAEACVNKSMVYDGNVVNAPTTMNSMTTPSDSHVYSYGNYYNWYSATAGNGTYATSANTNVAGDICPSGWRLPRGGDDTTGINPELKNEIWDLIINGINEGAELANSSDVVRVDKALRKYPNNFIYSGRLVGSAVNNRGNAGLLFTSTSSGAGTLYRMDFAGWSINPGTYSSGKYEGGTIRCVASVGD